MFALRPKREKLLADYKLLGRWGEKRGEKFLKTKGFRKLARNYSCKTGEIDLVMVDIDGSIVFIEVKTRASETFTPAEAVVTPAKKTSLFRAARYFLATNNIEDRPFRFDIVTVVLGKAGREKLNHYQNVFVP